MVFIFGPTPNTTDTVTFRFMNELYGLKANISENELIFDALNGHNVNKNDQLNVTLEYSGAIIEPPTLNTFVIITSSLVDTYYCRGIP